MDDVQSNYTQVTKQESDTVSQISSYGKAGFTGNK